MWTAILTFFGGIWAKISLYLIGSVAIVGLVAGIYWSITKNAAQDQALKDQNATLQQVIKDQKEFIAQTQQLAVDQQAATDDLNKQVATIQGKTDAINTFLNSSKIASQDRASSAILKQTNQKLQDQNLK